MEELIPKKGSKEESNGKLHVHLNEKLVSSVVDIL